MEKTMNPNQTIFNIPSYVKNMMLIETEGYQDQVIRPYQADLRHDHIDKLTKIVDQNIKVNGTKLTSNLISSIMPDAIMPTMAPIAKANIVGGWSEKRFRFTLLVETPKPNNMGYELVYLSGYTDHLGMSVGGHLDPNMKLFLNNVIVLDKVFNPRTQNYITRIIGHYQVVHMSGGGYGFEQVNPYDIGGNLMEVATPDSVIGRLISKETLGMYGGEEVTIRSSSVVDTQGETSVKVNSSNVMPSDYLSKVISRTLDTSMLSASGFPDANNIDVLTNTSAMLNRENDVSDILFFRKLTHINGFNPDRPYITIGELEKIDPSLANDNNRVQIFTGGGFIREQQMPEGFSGMAPGEFFSTQSEDPSLVSEENRIATYLAETITALMTKYALFDITVSASNITGQPVIAVGSTSTIIPDLNPVQMAYQAEAEFGNVIYPTVTRNNQMIVEIFAHASMTGDINITLSVNGNPYVKYTFPKAADSLFNPLIQNEQTMNQFTDNIGMIIDTIKDQVLY